ncbi:MAG: hypothetical protein GQ535_02990 [Rhodobacteraceae bacterium]|nr:hypothetical protein [Paracoccaceae bacterium]
MSKENEPVEEAALAPLPDPVEDEHEEEHHVSFAARSLQILALVVAGIIFGLWAGPRVAPHLPAGMAPVAAWLSPQTNASTDALEALRAETNLRLAVLETGIKREEIETRLANFQTDIVNPLRDQMNALSGQIAAADSTAIEARLWAVEGKVEGLIAELKSLQEMLGSVAAEGGAISADTAASIAAYRTRIDALQAQVNEITARQGELTSAVAAAQTTATERVEEAQTLVEEATETVVSGQNKAQLETALTALSAALQTAKPFTGPLAAITEISNVDVPEALVKASETGVWALEDLKSEFVPLAHAAIKADVATEGDSGITAFLRSQVTSRSLTPQEGTSADAVLSRIDPALQNDDLETVLREADALPEAPADVLAEWLAQVQARHAALVAFGPWEAALKAGE